MLLLLPVGWVVSHSPLPAVANSTLTEGGVVDSTPGCCRSCAGWEHRPTPLLRPSSTWVFLPFSFFFPSLRAFSCPWGSVVGMGIPGPSLWRAVYCRGVLWVARPSWCCIRGSMQRVVATATVIGCMLWQGLLVFFGFPLTSAALLGCGRGSIRLPPLYGGMLL